MLDQSRFSVERSPAKFTSRLFYVRVLHVHFKVIFRREHFFADVTLHRAIPTVRPQVLVPIMLLAEGFPAKLASERFRTGMSPEMHRQLCQIPEVLLANFTFPLPSMFGDVFAELFDGAHLFPAVVTDEGADVDFVVVTWIFEFIRAAVTFITVEIARPLFSCRFLFDDSFYFYYFDTIGL